MTVQQLVNNLEKTWNEHDKDIDPDFQGDYDDNFSQFLNLLQHKPDENPKTMKQLLKENQEASYYDSMTQRYNKGYDLHG